MKNLPATTAKPEIKIKENPKAEAIKKAPDEVIAMAIRDAARSFKTIKNRSKIFALRVELSTFGF